MVVYGDLVLLVNGAVDGALLLAAARLAGVRANGWRVALAAGIGAAYALGFYVWPLGAAYATAGKVAASVAMVLVAFAPQAPLRFARLLGWLWLGAAVLAGLELVIARLARPEGAAAAGAWTAGAEPSIGAFPWWALAGALGLLLLGASRFHFWRSLEPGRTVALRLELEGASTVLPALVDTGNRLRDPISGAPVAVAEVGSLRGLVPDPWHAALAAAVRDAREGRWTGAFPAADDRLARRLRVIPYGTVGSDGMLMVALRVDAASCTEPAPRHAGRAPAAPLAPVRPAAPVLVGLVDRRLDPAGGFRALVPPEFLELAPAAGRSADRAAEAVMRRKERSA